MRRDERLLVPDAKSPFSTSATESPRIAASRAMDAPVMPPPMTARSNVSLCRRFSKGPRSAAWRGAGPVLGIATLLRRGGSRGGLRYQLAGVQDLLGVQSGLHGGQPASSLLSQIALHPAAVLNADAVVVAEGTAVPHDGICGGGLHPIPLLHLSSRLPSGQAGV